MGGGGIENGDKGNGDEILHAGLDLLDRQVLDADGIPLGKVDDLRFEVGGEGREPVLAAILIGQQALGGRIGGRAGRRWSALAALLARRTDPAEVPAERIAEMGASVRLDSRAEEFPDLLIAERRLAESFVGRIPGSGDASG